MGHWESFERFWESLGMSWVGLWGSLDALGTVLGRSEGIWGCLGVVLGASSGGLDVIWGAFGMCLGDFGISQRGKKGSQEQLKKNTLTFDKSCSRVGASRVFRGRSIPGGIQNPSNIIPGSVGECTEGQIAGNEGSACQSLLKTCPEPCEN